MEHIKGIMILAVCLMVLGFSVSVLFGIWCMYQEGASEYKGLRGFAEEESETETDASGAVKKKNKVLVKPRLIEAGAALSRVYTICCRSPWGMTASDK